MYFQFSECQISFQTVVKGLALQLGAQSAHSDHSGCYCQAPLANRAGNGVVLCLCIALTECVVVFLALFFFVRYWVKFFIHLSVVFLVWGVVNSPVYWVNSNSFFDGFMCCILSDFSPFAHFPLPLSSAETLYFRDVSFTFMSKCETHWVWLGFLCEHGWEVITRSGAAVQWLCYCIDTLTNQELLVVLSLGEGGLPVVSSFFFFFFSVIFFLGKF